jgi:hypothetical protein
MLSAVRPYIESKVSAQLGDLLAKGEGKWIEAANAYRPMMKIIARSLAPGFTTRSIERQRQIANAIPDMRPKTEPASKQGRKKGENK